MRYFRKPDGWFNDDDLKLVENLRGAYLWAVGPDYSYALYKSGDVGEPRLSNEPFGTTKNEYQTSETEWAERNVKSGIWIEVNRDGWPL
jgi:hypothetical protein